MKHLLSMLLCSSVVITAGAKNYYISTSGNDSNAGTKESPFATLSHAQALVNAGDTVFLRGGTYVIEQGDIMKDDGLYAHVFDMAKSGTAQKHICYFGYPGERPVFDLSQVKPTDRRVSVFYVTGSYLHLFL